jgi:hypothetical protein
VVQESSLSLKHCRCSVTFAKGRNRDSTSLLEQSACVFLLEVLEHVPLLLYILAAKTLILCLAFAGVKMYQRRSLEGKLQAEKRKQSEKKAS